MISTQKPLRPDYLPRTNAVLTASEHYNNVILFIKGLMIATTPNKMAWTH